MDEKDQQFGAVPYMDNVLELNAALRPRTRSLAQEECHRLEEFAEFLGNAGESLLIASPMIKQLSKRLKFVETIGIEEHWKSEEVRTVYADLTYISKLSEELGLQVMALTEFINTVGNLIERMGNLRVTGSD